jgi:hypothetical protein
MNDAIEILDEVEQILGMNELSNNEQLSILWEYVQKKRTEFQPACGECSS